jgi:hypothetical protein
MLQDIDLKYVGGVLTSGTPIAAPAFTAAGTPVTAPSTPQPADHNVIAWTMDPALATGTSALTNGTVYLARLPIRSATTISTVWWCQTTGPVTPTAGQCYAGIYSTAGALLSSAAIESKTTNGLQSVALGSPQAVSVGYVWAAFVWNAATAPTVMRGGGQNSAANNLNLAAAALRFAVNGTTQTTLSAPITPASNTQTGAVALWAAVS